MSDRNNTLLPEPSNSILQVDSGIGLNRLDLNGPYAMVYKKLAILLYRELQKDKPKKSSIAEEVTNKQS